MQDKVIDIDNFDIKKEFGLEENFNILQEKISI
jgi:hypothetical protein